MDAVVELFGLPPVGGSLKPGYNLNERGGGTSQSPFLEQRRQDIPGTFHLGSFEGVFRTLGNKDASGEFALLPPQETAGVGGNGAGGAGIFCDFRPPEMRDP